MQPADMRTRAMPALLLTGLGVKAPTASGTVREMKSARLYVVVLWAPFRYVVSMYAGEPSEPV